MYLLVEENPNCAADERVFSESGEKRGVRRLHLAHPKDRSDGWRDVTAVNARGNFTPAHAQRIEDSSDGTAWLVFGEEWGLRFRSPETSAPWSLDDPRQWGAPFLVLDSSGSAIDFA